MARHGFVGLDRCAVRAAAARCAVLLAAAGPALAAPPWPEPGVPDGARVHSVGPEMVMNGVPARIVQFELRGSTADVLAFYRRRFGPRHVENTVQGAQVVGAMDGDHYHTVQIKPLGLDSVQGTIMTTSLRGSRRSAVALDMERMLPADSSVLSQLQSNDAGQRSVMLIAANTAAVQANRDHLVKSFQDRGFRVVREENAPVDGRPALSLLLAAPAEEATVTIADAGRYRALTIHRLKEARP